MTKFFKSLIAAAAISVAGAAHAGISVWNFEFAQVSAANTFVVNGATLTGQIVIDDTYPISVGSGNTFASMTPITDPSMHRLEFQIAGTSGLNGSYVVGPAQSAWSFAFETPTGFVGPTMGNMVGRALVAGGTFGDELGADPGVFAFGHASVLTELVNMVGLFTVALSDGTTLQLKDLEAPEPVSVALAGLGLLGLAASRRRRLPV